MPSAFDIETDAAARIGQAQHGPRLILRDEPASRTVDGAFWRAAVRSPEAKPLWASLRDRACRRASRDRSNRGRSKTAFLRKHDRSARKKRPRAYPDLFGFLQSGARRHQRRTRSDRTRDRAKTCPSSQRNLPERRDVSTRRRALFAARR